MLLPTRRLICFAMVCFLTAAAEPALATDGLSGHRVAGLIEVQGGGWIALIETPGGQAIFRPGDALGGGSVTDIGREGVIVVLAGSRYLLPLEGDAVALSAAPAASEAMVVSGRVGMYALDFEVLKARLADAAEPPTREESRNPDYVGDRIREALALPPGTRVDAINERKLTVGREALLVVTSEVQSGSTINLRVSGLEAADRVYVTDSHGGGTP